MKKAIDHNRPERSRRISVTIDKGKCIGCFACEDITNGLFKVEDGLSKFNSKADLKDKEVQDKVKLAIEACPTGAIKAE